MSSEIAAWINSVPRSIIYSILLANKEQEHGPLQMFGPANGVSNNVALEKIDCMLILRNIQREHHGHPRSSPSYAPVYIHLLFPLRKFIHTKYTIYIFFKYSYNQKWRYE